MWLRQWVLSVLLVSLGSAALPTEEFVPLFPDNGAPKGWTVCEWNDLAKRAPAGTAWRVKDGVLRPGGRRETWLASEKEYGDFVMEFDRSSSGGCESRN